MLSRLRKDMLVEDNVVGERINCDEVSYNLYGNDRWAFRRSGWL